MNLGLRRGPNVSEAGARPSTFPPSRQAMDALREPRTSEERKAREERNRQWAEQEVAARAAEKQRTEADWAARQQKQQKIEATAAEAANVWIAERAAIPRPPRALAALIG